jgi:glycosyltransferase involved in cell wall biosynthesis
MIQFQLVVPAYNEENNIELIANRFIQAAKSSNFTAEQAQLIMVNNGSTDGSKAVFAKLMQKPEMAQWIQVVEVVVNKGYGFGLLAGLKSTQAPVVGWSHADMQCDPSDAFKALEILKSKGDSQKWLIKGVRFERNPKDIFVSRFFEFLATVCLGHRFYEINAQPKVFKREVLNLLVNPPFDFAFDLYVLFKAMQNGYNIETIDVKFPPRIHGTSKWATHFFSRYKTILKMMKFIWFLRGERQ